MRDTTANSYVDTGELPTTESQARSSSRRDDHYVCGLATPESDRFVGLEHDPGPRSGYRGSDLVHWHRPEIRAAAATESGFGGEVDAAERHLGGRGDSWF